MRSRVVQGLLAMALAVLAPATGALAQTTTGSIRGYVKDQSGAPLAEAQVLARNVDMGVSRGTLSNAEGFYNLAGLRPGSYELTIRRLGFTMQTRAVTVSIGETVSLDLQMQQAATQLTGVVVVSAPTQTAKTSEIGTGVSREKIRDLPSADRNFLDLTGLVPGITPKAVNNGDKFFAAGGQPAEAINVFVDGATYKNDVLRGGVVGQDASKGNPFPQGAVQEFRVITQNYKAEYQKASSAIITATTRSGGINWEAELFGNNISKAYVARDAIATRNGDARPNYNRLQGGGSLSGPLVANKLFFFGTYELNARDEPEYVRLGGDAANAPASLNLQQYLGQHTSTFKEHLGFGKLTWVKSDRSTVDASLNVRSESDFRGFGGQTAFEASEDVKINVYTGVVNWKYSGDRWLNEAQFNGQNFIWNPTWTNGDLIGKNYFGLLRIGGKDSEQKFKQRRLSFRDDVTRSGAHWNGDHVIKMGASVDFLAYESNKRFTENPVFNFRSDEQWSRPFEAFFGFGNPTISTNNTQIGAYIQDDWTVTPKLTLNVGIRWDAETNMINNDYVTPSALADSLRGPLAGQFYVDVPKLKADGTCCDNVRRRVVDELGGINRYITTGSSDRKMYLGAFQPRLGASYDLTGDGRTVLFAGAGLYFDRNYWNTLLDEQFRRQYSVLKVSFNDVGSTTGCAACVKWDPKYFDPAQLRSLAGTAGLPEVFLVANDLKPPRTVQFSAGVRRGIGNSLLTVTYNGVRGTNGMNFVRATPWGGLGPNYAQAFITDDRVKTWYDAMQLQWERPLRESHRWGGAVAYTLARSLEQGQSQDIFWPFDDRYPVVSDLPKRRAPGDQRHTVVAHGIVKMPWKLRASSVVTLGSGISVNATDASNGWDLAAQRTYVYVPPTSSFLGVGHVFGTQNMDLRLERTFSFASAQSMSVIAELFNALDSDNFGCYDATIYPTSGNVNANYGKPGCAALGRRFQIGLRYGFRPTSGSGK